ncbi:hypothetical protein GGI17_004062 [Coemansia sp. S146]|nr:hypothetical protein GGI17_004062 [Coemansia sp. S146]
MDDNWTLMKRGLPGVPTWQEYLTDHLPAGTRVGIDPTLLSSAEGTSLKKTLNVRGNGDLVAIEENLIDIVWGSQRPPRPQDKVFIHDVKYAGEPHADKITHVRAGFESLDTDGLVVAALDEIAWLFNLRGSDIDYNPVFFAHALVTKADITLYIDDAKLDSNVRSHFQGIKPRPYNAIFGELDELSASLVQSKRKLLAGQNASWALVKALGEDNVKLEHELLFNGSHLRLSEVDVADKLEELRRAQKHCVGLSFDTISPVGPNGAIIHYSPKRGSDALLDVNKMYVCDSDGQYLDGTTDVTRTYHFGTPSAWECECFTRVLKGHIALDRAVFPSGTSGYALNPLARLPL